MAPLQKVTGRRSSLGGAEKKKGAGQSSPAPSIFSVRTGIYQYRVRRFAVWCPQRESRVALRATLVGFVASLLSPQQAAGLLRPYGSTPWGVGLT